MRIAIISTACLPVPPRSYGGTEFVIAELASALVALGHEVTTFATGDSAPAGNLRVAIPAAVWPPDPLMDMVIAHRACQDLLHGAIRADVVHVHTPAALAYAPYISAPVVYTVHHAPTTSLDAFYQHFPGVRYVLISEQQRSLHPDLHGTVVHHGIATERYHQGNGRGGYLVYLGRLAAEKGPHIAIDVARAVGSRIRLAGNPHPTDHEYYEHELRARMSLPGVEWDGEANQEQKQDLLGGARALLFPIRWDEPFGLVMIESMLCGTPVIAFRRGSVPEIIDEGVTGFIVDTEREMTDAVGKLGLLDRNVVRERALSRWSSTRMAQDYLGVYSSAGARRVRFSRAG